jgi:hypothetical protein
LDQHAYLELGFARLTLGVLGLLILWIPFQQRRRWAWLAMLLFEVLYLIPTLGVRAGLTDLNGSIGHTSAFTRIAPADLVAGLCILIGLGLSLRDFFWQHKQQ